MCTHTHTHTHTYINKRTRTHERTHARARAHTHTHTSANLPEDRPRHGLWGLFEDLDAAALARKATNRIWRPPTPARAQAREHQGALARATDWRALRWCGAHLSRAGCPRALAAACECAPAPPPAQLRLISARASRPAAHRMQRARALCARTNAAPQRYFHSLTHPRMAGRWLQGARP